MSRKGLSDVVTNVLIILIVLVATIIVWNFIKPIITGVNLDTAQFTTQLSVPEEGLVVDQSNNLLSIDIQRGAGEGEIAGFIFGLQDPTGVVRTFRQNITISQLEMRNFVVNYSEYMIDDVVSISVTPIYRNNQTGKEQVGIPIEQEVKNKAPLAPTVYNLPDGLVAHWRFDQNWVDSEGGFNGATNGGAGFSTNIKRLGSASLDVGGQSTNYSRISHADDFNSPSFTIVAWVYPKNLNDGASIFTKSNTGSGYSLRHIAGRWEFRTMLSTTQRNVYSVPNNLNSQSWNFVAASYASSSMNLYLNSERYQNNSLSHSSYTPGAVNLQIGPSFNGNIDEFMFFNRELTAQEISDIRTKYTR